MLQFRRAGSPPPETGVYPRRAFELIETFRRWIGHDRLQEARELYYGNPLARGLISTALLRENQPLIEAFDTYEKVTLGRQRIPKRLPDELADLAAVAAQFSMIGPTLVDEVERHHRHAVCGPGFRSVLLEWKAAASLVRTNGARISWLPPSQPGPELVARIDEFELELECKYVSHMITELLGDDQASALAEGIVDCLREKSLAGEIRIEVFPTANAFCAAECLTAIRQHFDHVASGECVVDIPGLLKLETSLVSSGDIAIAPAEWQARMATTKAPDARAYGSALAKSSLAVDPITIFMTGPRRNAGQLLNHLWERKFRRAAEQCTGSRGAAIVIEWEGYVDVTTFAESEGIQALLARTFDEHRHIAGIVLRCDTSPMRLGGMLNYATPAYIARSGVTKYPKIAKLLQFG